MLEQFLHHIEQNNLCTRADKILLTVSGGIDSMVMLHLFREAGFNVGIAHCNFQLRGEESRGDEALVNIACVDFGLPFHGRRFETAKFASENSISIQMAARQLRYDFFEALVNQYDYKYIATAHHLNDNIETVLLNLVRGTGMDGLAGIPIKHKNVIRPLLFASREMIEEYASFNRLTWREDSSNASDKYYRNLIRHQVIPHLKNINPGLEQNFNNSLERIRGAVSLASQALQKFKHEGMHEKDNRLYIDRHQLNRHDLPAVVLWELLKEKGFNYTQCCEVIQSHHQSGKVFYSQTHRLNIDRDDFIVSGLETVPDVDVMIEDGEHNVERAGQTLTLDVLDSSDFSRSSDPCVAQLDYARLRFPFTWRKWKAGDRFKPLGMSYHKKLSDFLIDLKVSLPDKEDVTVLTCADEIVWVVGHRISDAFKVTSETRRIQYVRLHKS